MKRVFMMVFLYIGLLSIMSLSHAEGTTTLAKDCYGVGEWVDATVTSSMYSGDVRFMIEGITIEQNAKYDERYGPIYVITFRFENQTVSPDIWTDNQLFKVVDSDGYICRYEGGYETNMYVRLVPGEKVRGIFSCEVNTNDLPYVDVKLYDEPSVYVRVPLQNTSVPTPTHLQPSPTPKPTQTPETSAISLSQLSGIAEKKGCIVMYGNYEQDNNKANGKEPIEWVVLDYDQINNRVLVISRYGLVARNFHSKGRYPTWANSTMRKWLNDTFIKTAFSKNERKAICKVVVSTNDYEGHSGGKDTQDYLWLLSVEEAELYFEYSFDRATTPTASAQKQGADVVGGKCWWWLRSPAVSDDSCASIKFGGSIDDYSAAVYNCEGGCVRPAMWIDLGKLP